MNRNRCSSGRPPEGPGSTGTPIPGFPAHRRHVTAPRPTARPLLAALLLAALLLPAAGAPGAATPGEEAGPTCPAERELCVQAERSGGIDLKTGVATLEGNVRGIVRSRDLSFSGQSLKAFRNGGQEWVRLVLEHNVNLRQGERRSESDHGVLEREEIRLTGNVRIDQADLTIEGHEAVIRSADNRTVVRGLPDAPLTVLLRRALLEEDSGASAAAEDTTTLVRAQKAVVEDQPRRVVLTGDVHIEQSNERLRLDAQQVTLFFAEGSALDSFRAEGNVVMTQPERRITADYAQSRSQLRTILLVGHATMQQKGAFDLKSDRMEVYSDASKGIMQSHDRQKPITLSLDLAGNQTYGLTQAGMLKLSGKAVPSALLEKLAPLIGKTYPSRAAFREAVSQRLTRREADAHLETILANAR